MLLKYLPLRHEGSKEHKAFVASHHTFTITVFNHNSANMKKQTKWVIGLGALLAAAAATAAIWVQAKSHDKQRPPKNAPQLDLDNPGTQAEFPTSASESEVG